MADRKYLFRIDVDHRRQIIEHGANELDIVRPLVGFRSGKASRIPGQKQIGQPGAVGIDRDKPGLVGLFIHAAEPDHAASIDACAVQHEHHWRRVFRVVLRRHMNKIGPRAAVDLQVPLIITRTRCIRAERGNDQNGFGREQAGHEHGSSRSREIRNDRTARDAGLYAAAIPHEMSLKFPSVDPGRRLRPSHMPRSFISRGASRTSSCHPDRAAAVGTRSIQGSPRPPCRPLS